MQQPTSLNAASVATGRHRLQALGMLIGAVALVASSVLPQVADAAGTPPAPAPVPVDPAPVPEGLKGVPVPVPANIGEFVLSKSAAIRLGKALFWDMQLGSDGKTACASCHFLAGADPRSRNQVSPGLNRVNADKSPNPDVTFQVGGPNYQLKASDFPFHKFSDPKNRNSSVIRSFNDIASSQGVFKSQFIGVTPGASQDQFNLTGDPVFNKDGLQTRRDEPRNAPTVINSIFNFRNFWDGRATYLFNGVSPFGAMDEAARVYKLVGTSVTPVQVRIPQASLASLATGPALSDFEMSGAGRTWPHIGKRLLTAKPLALQKVSSTDSVLAGVRNISGVGLVGDYQAMVKAAFKPEWLKGTQKVTLNGAQYSQAEANFSLFFGLAIQMYGATLVSDDSPFDRHMAGNTTAMSQDAKQGMSLFFGKGKCAECHGGAEFTNASVRNVLKGPLSRMVMGNGGTAVYDEGFYNTAVAKTLEDIANGGKNPVGRPLALSALAQQVSAAEFERLIGIPPNVAVAAGERIAVNGAFKTPTIRNVELTAPYFHNGDSLTLLQTVQFYNRGGNHFNNNLADVDPEIEPLGLSQQEMEQLVEFMKATTDDRVRFEKAPFDHPQLIVPNGHEVVSGRLVNDGGKAKDTLMDIPAVGASGRSTPAAPFLSSAGSQYPYFSLMPQHSLKCVDVPSGAKTNGAAALQVACKAADTQLWEQVPNSNGFALRNKATGLCLDVSGISFSSGATIYTWSCLGTANQTFNWSGNRLVVKHSNQCVNINGNATADNTKVIQWPCSTSANNDQFLKQ